MMIEAWSGRGTVHIRNDCPALPAKPKFLMADHANVRCELCLTHLFQQHLARTYKERVDAANKLRPHGTHAAFARHKKRGEEPCLACVRAERIYNTERKRMAREKVGAE